MTKQPFAITEAELKKIPRSEQRRLLELGYVVGSKGEVDKVQEKPQL